jgi:molecular chaperone GrpE
MKRKFNICEKPLPIASVDESADIEGRGILLIKRCARLMNDLENEREIVEQWKEHLYLELLEVVDSLERIVLQAEKSSGEAAPARLIEHIYAAAHQLSWLLKRRGVAPFDTVGKEAAPELTEIIGIEVRDDCLDGEVIEEIEKGYLLKGKLLRRAKVKVAKKREG